MTHCALCRCTARARSPLSKVELEVKLHQLACHLADQAMAQGPTINMNEYWVERAMQVVKRIVKYRMTAYPEKVYLNDALLQDAMGVHRELYPRECLSFAELQPAYRNRAYGCGEANRDDLGVQLLGAGKALTPEEETSARDQLADLMLLEPEWHAGRGWHQCASKEEYVQLIASARFNKHNRAALASEGTMTSCLLYTSPSPRDS